MPCYEDKGIYNEKGLTLIEVLVSLVLLSLLTVSILGIFTPTARWIAIARQETTASNYASAVLEDLREERNYIDNKDDVPVEEFLSDHNYPSQEMDAYITMKKISSFENLYNITVTVNRSGDTESHILQMSTIMRKE